MTDSIDDDLATRIARSMGYRGVDENAGSEDYARLPAFGPRKIHSTAEVEPDSLAEVAAQSDVSTTIIAINGVRYTVTVPAHIPAREAARWAAVELIWNGPINRSSIIKINMGYTDQAPKIAKIDASSPRRVAQWNQKFHERRPTEAPRVGRPKRRRR